MNINATLLGQMITFMIFVWFTMKFVWPQIMDALQEREDKIAEGLAAAERGQHNLELAKNKIADELRDAKVEAGHIVDSANKRASAIVEEAQHKARDEGLRLIAAAEDEITQQITRAKAELKQQVAGIAVKGAEKIIGHNLDTAANSGMVDNLIEEL